MHICASQFSKFPGGACPRTPLEGARAGPRRDRVAITSLGVLEFHAPPPPPPWLKSWIPPLPASSLAFSPISSSWNSSDSVRACHTLLSRHRIIRKSATSFQNSPPYQSCVAFTVNANDFPDPAAPTAAPLRIPSTLMIGREQVAHLNLARFQGFWHDLFHSPVPSSPLGTHLLDLAARHDSDVDEHLVQFTQTPVTATRHVSQHVNLSRSLRIQVVK